jgi:mono/diheme cytochrome c family protein
MPQSRYLACKSLIKGSSCGTWPVLALLVFLLAYVPTLVARQDAEEIYNHRCAVCHGKDGSGNTVKGKKVHVKDVHTNMKDSKPEMIKAVTNGKGDDMDSYKKEYTAHQIKELVAYYRSLGGAVSAKANGGN